MNVADLKQALERYPDVATVAVYVDGSVQGDGIWAVEPDNLDLELDADNTGGLEPPVLYLNFDAAAVLR